MEYHSYVIVQNHLDKFLKEVNNKLASGYVPIGGVCVLPPTGDVEPRADFYFQAMALPLLPRRRARS